MQQVIKWVALLAVLAALLFAFWPRPVPVDVAQVGYRALAETVSEQGRTRVRNRFQVSAPVAGHLQRLELEAGDKVQQGQLLAMITPGTARLLDSREYSEAAAALDGAHAAKSISLARLSQTGENVRLAEQDNARIESLYASHSVGLAELQRAQRDLANARAEVAAAQSELVLREAEIKAAASRLAGQQTLTNANANGSGTDMGTKTNTEAAVPVLAPISGTVLQVLQKSAQEVLPGTLLLELADLDRELEVLVELLTSDAVRVTPGDAVEINDWGGAPLMGRVDRVEPGGFIKFSALGVEEQRVNTLIRFSGSAAERARLGDGFRVDCTITTWAAEHVLSVPISALFRQGDAWAVFKVVHDRLELVPLEIGHKNASYAEVLAGLSEDDIVVLYPDPQLAPGVKVIRRDE
ncbi:biotin/lipoyl-binding protein [Shewanella cyperi]|uniref:Biotin/lipoyl-binding protein n=1 Tax=Shewanella cyperi TaxID=2814292 RepID=A0A974XK48_9GAMM|nr:HlyD family efflux transporter periplasmic adaptor subunit [Shewanella cyperi]QSX28723.1 biotin/lipoyl-binding protein [Shewanella cyperi]